MYILYIWHMYTCNTLEVIFVEWHYLWKSVSSPLVTYCVTRNNSFHISRIPELSEGKIYRRFPHLVVKSMISCQRKPLIKPIYDSLVKSICLMIKCICSPLFTNIQVLLYPTSRPGDFPSKGISGPWNGGTVPCRVRFWGRIPLHSPYIGLIYQYQKIGHWGQYPSVMLAGL